MASREGLPQGTKYESIRNYESKQSIVKYESVAPACCRQGGIHLFSPVHYLRMRLKFQIKIVKHRSVSPYDLRNLEICG